MKWRRPTLRVSRDGILFVAGLVGVLYETVGTKVDRPSLLFLFGAMIGLPAFLRTDEKRIAPPAPPAPPEPGYTPSDPEIKPKPRKKAPPRKRTAG